MSNTTRRRVAATSVGAPVTAVLAMQTAPALADHFVYTQTNDSKNAVVAFRRDDDGNLTPVTGSPFATGGAGVFNPAGVLGPGDADRQVTVDRDRFLLFAVNAGRPDCDEHHWREVADVVFTSISTSGLSSVGNVLRAIILVQN